MRQSFACTCAGLTSWWQWWVWWGYSGNSLTTPFTSSWCSDLSGSSGNHASTCKRLNQVIIPKRLNQVIMHYTQKVKTECLLMWYNKMREILENLFGLGVVVFTQTPHMANLTFSAVNLLHKHYRIVFGKTVLFKAVNRCLFHEKEFLMFWGSWAGSRYKT